MNRPFSNCLAALCLLSVACTSAPLTGRSQFLPFPASVENEIGANAWEEALLEADQEGVLVTSGPQAAEVRHVGRAIANAAKRHPETSQLTQGYDWEFVLIESDQVNAWALPGGRSAVYTGLLGVATDEDELAAVMGHEVAHALARHAGERMTQVLIVNAGLTAAMLLSEDMDPEDRELLLASLGLVSETGVLLPFSRTHESEADEIGLLLSADAGYDPRAAVRLWKKMAALSADRPPELLSTHPSEATRLADLAEIMPEAMQVWMRAKSEGR